MWPAFVNYLFRFQIRHTKHLVDPDGREGPVVWRQGNREHAGTFVARLVPRVESARFAGIDSDDKCTAVL